MNFIFNFLVNHDFSTKISVHSSITQMYASVHNYDNHY